MCTNYILVCKAIMCQDKHKSQVAGQQTEVPWGVWCWCLNKPNMVYGPLFCTGFSQLIDAKIGQEHRSSTKCLSMSANIQMPYTRWPMTKGKVTVKIT